MAQYPVIRQFPLAEASPSQGNRIRAVDVGRCLSQANRRIYRYGRSYEVKIDLEANSGTTLEVYALRNDWPVVKAFQMAHAEYLKNTADERANLSKDQLARWEDFRISHGQPSVTDVGPQFFQGGVQVSNLVGQGEFALSNVVDSSGTRYVFSWTGTSSSGIFSVLGEYEKTANANARPSSIEADAPYVEIDSEVNELTHDDLQNDGDLPPYEQNAVNADAPFVKIATLDSSNPNAQKLSTGYFTVPCGLILIAQTAYSDIAGKYSMTAKAGSYKGVHAPSLLE
jgi:hypothetical protein